MIFAFIIQSPAKLQWVEINLRINPRLPEIASTVELELKNTQYWDGQGLHSSVGLDDKSCFPQFILNWLGWVIIRLKETLDQSVLAGKNVIVIPLLIDL